ncbi:LysR family transcriptional regulator [Candidatus Stoquefichus massiliensis]|uniref:LysR family transcriptional regulator n=1 Tax=Candidatus Stoquefichus massiliensis TaxID=1470350 RepID=UPI0004898E11|nr:LysR family transcriptional regulator [Candidatus Stoquefichus massiliensis]
MIDMKLKTFIEVVDCKSFTQAAMHLHLTQPAVTQHIKQLESYYQHKLIQNPHKEFELTEAGHQLYEYAKIQIHNEEIFESQLYKVAMPLTVGATLSIADYYLPQIISHYVTHSLQRCQIYVHNTQMLIQEMIDGHIDCAFVEGQFDLQLFEYHLFKNERFIVVARHNHPLAHKKITLSQLLSYPLFVREKGSGTRAILENYLLQSLYDISSFHQIIEVQSMTMIKKMIMQTYGISFLYEGVVSDELKSGQLIRLDLENFELTRPMHFIYLRHNLNKQRYLEFFQQLIQ